MIASRGVVCTRSSPPCGRGVTDLLPLLIVHHVPSEQVTTDSSS